MNLLIRRSGLLSTVQDLGRYGNRRFGINPNGVMDTAAARVVNVLLGNDENAAVIEMHFPACEIEFEATTTFAVGGADFGAELNGVPMPHFQTVTADAGSALRFTAKRKGNRAYLGVAGGVLVEDWFGSRSTNLTAGYGGFKGRKLLPGDRLENGEGVFVKDGIGPARSLLPHYSRFPTVRFIPGAEYGLFTAKSEQDLLHHGFHLSNDSNRMGFRLAGEPLHLLEAKEMISAAVTFGTMQLLPDGQLVVLMADHQTTGGYPRIGHVISHDLPLLGQLGPGDGVGFHAVTIAEAELLSATFTKDLNLMKMGVRLAAAR